MGKITDYDYLALTGLDAGNIIVPLVNAAETGVPNPGGTNKYTTLYDVIQKTSEDLSLAPIPWQASYNYSVGQRVLSPDGSTVRCKTNHFSASYFDARNWIWPTDDGDTVFDFSQLPNGNANTIRPAKGAMNYFGIADAKWADLIVLNGRLTTRQGADVALNTYYLQGELLDKNDPIQHIWAIVDCSAAPVDQQALVLLVAGKDGPWFIPGTASNRAGIHWTINANITGTLRLVFQAGPYNATDPTYGSMAAGETYNRPTAIGNISGQRIRIDITVDKRTGAMKGFINGVLVIQYTDPLVRNYISPYGMIESSTGGPSGPPPTWNVVQFGISPNLPHFALDGTRRGTLSQNAFTPVVTLTTTWQLVHTVFVAYDDGGAVEISWFVYVQCSAGFVECDLSTTGAAPVETFNRRIAQAGTNCCVPFIGIRDGVPGTTESVGVWMRTTGTASIPDATVTGSTTVSPRWRPAQRDARIR